MNSIKLYNFIFSINIKNICKLIKLINLFSNILYIIILKLRKIISYILIEKMLL